MKATVCFVHDAPLVKAHSSEIVYSQGFGYSIWKRYLEIFDSLIVCTRMSEGETGKLIRSSGPGVTFEPITSYQGPRSLAFRLPEIWRQLSGAIERADAVILRLPSILGWIGYFVAMSQRKKILIELVGCPRDAFSSLGGIAKLLAPLVAILTKYQVARASHCIYVTKSYLQQKYPSTGISASISNVELHLNQDSALVRSQKSVKRIGSVGQVDLKYKGFDLMISALKYFPNLKYEIVGGGNAASLRAYAEALGVSDRVVIRGPLPHEKVLEWLDSVDVFVQPSLTEGLPRAVVEAMSRALPVVGSRVGGIPELIAPEWLFPAGDESALTETLKRIIDSDNLSAIGLDNYRKSKLYDAHRLQKKRNRILASLSSGA